MIVVIMDFKYTIKKGEKYYIAECKDTGVISQGKNKKEALENLIEARKLYLEEFSQQ